MKKITITSLVLLWAFLCPLYAADLINVLPVTNEIIMVQYDEGHIDYNGVPEGGDYKTGPFEGQTTNKVYYSLLDVDAALSEANYSISSVDDPNYSSPLNPTYIGYKAKGTEFNSPSKSPEFLKEYKMYVVLPHALERGKTYSIELKGLADNTDSYTFVFEETEQRSPTVHVNQVGFEPNQPKYAYLSQWMGNFNYNGQDSALDLSGFTDNDYYLYDLESKSIARTYSNNITVQIDDKENSTTEARVYSCDFSDFTSPGKYVLVVEGIGCSYPFEIQKGIYRGPFHSSMRGLYFNRQGIVKRADEFGNKIYPRSQHPEDVQYYYDGTQKSYTHDLNGFDFSSNPVDGIWGHYYDAGDWDHYSKSHWKVPMYLLMLYDIKPEAFADGDIGNSYKFAESDAEWVDEGSNGLPDLLDEGKWLLDFYKRTKDALISQGYGTGGIPTYVGADAGATGKPSWADTRDMAVKAEMPGATFSYAGMAAYFAHCLNEYHQDVLGNNDDHPDYNGWVTEATDAYNWAVANAEDTVSSGAYNDNQLIAAVAMFIITQDATYEDDFYAAWQKEKNVNDGAWVGPSHNMVAAAIYVLNCEAFANPSIFHEIEDNMISRANVIADHTENEHYRLGGTEPNQWIQMNKYSIPRSFFSIVAYERTGTKKYLDDIYNSANYVLGGNPLNKVKISGLGHDAERAAFYPDAWYLLDYNSKVYTNPMLPGYSVYGRPTFDVSGPGSETWARSSAEPSTQSWNSDVWPMAETRFESRYSIAGSEFTIHQNNLWHVLTYGYLCNLGDSFTPNERPTVGLNLTESQDVDIYTPIDLTVTASPDVAKVAYYYDWHFIGESRDAANDFLFSWDVLKSSLGEGDEPVITAVAYDDKGLETMPADAGDKAIKLIFGSLDETPPTTPGNFTAYNIQTGQADLSWNASTDDNKVDGYAIVDNNNTVDTLKVVSGTTTTTTLTGLFADTNYDLKVVAFDLAGNTAESNTATFTTESALCGNCSASTVNGGFENKLEGWNVVGVSDKIGVDDSKVHTGESSLILKGNNNEVVVEQTISGLCPNTTYRLHVWGYADGGASAIYLKAYGYGDESFAATSTGGGIWEEITLDFTTTGTNTSVTIQLYRDKWNWCYVDDVSIETVGQGECPEYTLNISNPNGSVVKDPDKSSYYEGEFVKLKAVPDFGYDFIEWTGDFSSTKADTMIRITSEVSVTANFASDGVLYSLTVNNGSGSGNYPANEITAVVANAAPEGMKFDKWTGDVANLASVYSEATTITMPANNIQITATYKDIVLDCILDNPSFEDGQTGWKNIVENVTLIEDATDGVYAASIPNAGGIENKIEVSVDEGTTVTLNFMAKIDGATGFYAVGLDFEDADQETLHSEMVTNIVADWGSYQITYDAPAGTEYVKVWAYTSSGGLVADDFCLSGVVRVPVYALIVNNGEGSGSYKEGDQVAIEAGEAPIGQNFYQWTGDVDAVADINSAVTTLTMPADNIEITATYDTGVGVREIALDKISLHPNPAVNWIEIKSEIEVTKVEVFSASGALVLVKQAGNAKTVDLNIGDLAGGYYLVCVSMEDGSRKNTPLVIRK